MGRVNGSHRFASCRGTSSLIPGDWLGHDRFGADWRLLGVNRTSTSPHGENLGIGDGMLPAEAPQAIDVQHARRAVASSFAPSGPRIDLASFSG